MVGTRCASYPAGTIQHGERLSAAPCITRPCETGSLVQIALIDARGMRREYMSRNDSGIRLGASDGEPPEHAIQHCRRIVEIAACPRRCVGRHVRGLNTALRGPCEHLIYQRETQRAARVLAGPPGGKAGGTTRSCHRIAPQLIEQS